MKPPKITMSMFQGWRADLHGNQDKDLLHLMAKEYIIRKAVFRSHAGFAASVADTSHGRFARVEFQDNDGSDDDIAVANIEELAAEVTGEDGANLENASEGEKYDDDSASFELNSESKSSIGPDDDEDVGIFEEVKQGKVARVQDGHKTLPRSFKPSAKIANELNDDTLMDGKEVMRTLGRPNKRQVHYLGLRSAYESCSSGGEPVFTCSRPAGAGHASTDESAAMEVECMDYIFYSSARLLPVRIMSIPSLSQLLRSGGGNPSEPMLCDDVHQLEPPRTMSELFNVQSALLKSRSSSFIKTVTEASESNSDVFNDNDVKKGPPPRARVLEMKKMLVDVLERSKSVGSGGGSEGAFWAGMYTPPPAKSSSKHHAWLPNDSFTSSHLALCAEFSFIER